MKKTHDIHRWIFEIPLHDVQDDSATDHLYSGGQCLLCGKRIKNNKYAVHLLTNGNLVSSDQPFEEKEDQGFFDIGNECRKRLPNNFYFKI